MNVELTRTSETEVPIEGASGFDVYVAERDGMRCLLPVTRELPDDASTRKLVTRMAEEEFAKLQAETNGRREATL